MPFTTRSGRQYCGGVGPSPRLESSLWASDATFANEVGSCACPGHATDSYSTLLSQTLTGNFPMQLLPAYLDPKCFPKARLVCQSWDSAITSHITSLEIRSHKAAMPRGSCKVAARLVRKATNLLSLKMEVPSNLTLDLASDLENQHWNECTECSKMTPRVASALRQFQSACNLQQLTLVNKDSTWFSVADTVGRFLPRLRKLCLSGCPFTVADMLCIGSRLTSLSELVISSPIHRVCNGRCGGCLA
jgi:hypothetical protein